MYKTLAQAFAVLFTLIVGAATLGAIMSLGACQSWAHVDNGPTLRQVAGSTVLVDTENGSGSGTVIRINKDGSSDILTCAHVIEGDDPAVLKVVYPGSNGHRYEYPAIILASDPSQDLAILRVKVPLGLRPLKLANHEPQLYDDLYVVGAPAGQNRTAATGILTNKQVIDRRHGDLIMWQVTSFVFPGVSGGTVTNAQGELVGVPEMMFVFKGGLPVPQIGYVIPLARIRAFVESHR